MTVHISGDIAARLAIGGGDLSHRALEGLALEDYKSGHITDPELRVALGFETRHELDGFLKAHGVYEDFTMEDFERDLAHPQRGDSHRCGWSSPILNPSIV